MEKEVSRYGASSSFIPEFSDEPKRKKYKKDAYFSDEEEIDDDWKNPRHLCCLG